MYGPLSGRVLISRVVAIFMESETELYDLHFLLGWGGENCHEDVDECASNPCNSNGGECQDEFNRYKCNCFPGFRGGCILRKCLITTSSLFPHFNIFWTSVH